MESLAHPGYRLGGLKNVNRKGDVIPSHSKSLQVTLGGNGAERMAIQARN